MRQVYLTPDDIKRRYLWAYEEAQIDIEIVAKCLAKYAPPEAIHEAMGRVNTARAEKALLHALITKRSGDPIEYLDLPQRIYYALKRAGIETIDDIKNHLKAFDGRFNIRNFGDVSRKQLFDAMAERGYEIPISTP